MGQMGVVGSWRGGQKLSLLGALKWIAVEEWSGAAVARCPADRTHACDGTNNGQTV